MNLGPTTRNNSANCYCSIRPSSIKTTSDIDAIVAQALASIGQVRVLTLDISSTPEEISMLPIATVSSDINLDGDLIATAFQSELVITTADNEKPIVATFGCGPCVALGGYDPTNKIAFVVHFATAAEVTKYGDFLYHTILKLVKTPMTPPMQLHLRGGLEGVSEDTVEAIKNWITVVLRRERLLLEIVSEDILSSIDFEEKSLLIDSRTGEVSTYDPMSNPKRRPFSKLEELAAMVSAFLPTITLAYAPK